MGYYTAIRLHKVRVKKKFIAEVRKYIADHKIEDEGFHYFLHNLELDDAGNVSWIGMPSGKWHRDKEFVLWLAPYVAAGGQVSLTSKEGDGAAWAYKFDGRGGVAYRDLPPPPPEPFEMEWEEDGPMRRMHYDPAARVLKLEFDGGKVYRHEGVPLDVAEELAGAHIPIAVFNQRIRKAYPAQKDVWID